MPRRALVPDLITCSVAISACEKGIVPQKAHSLSVGMQRRASSPDIIIGSAAISAGEKGSVPRGLSAS